MTKSLINNRISRVFIGSIIWLAYYLYVFSHEAIWDITVLHTLTTLGYSEIIVSLIASLFFAFAGFNLYKSSLSKSKGSASLQNFLHVLIVALIAKFLVQLLVFEYGDLYAFYGIVGLMVVEENTLASGLAPLFFQFFQLLYITLVILFIYQLKMARVTLNAMNKLKLLIVVVIYASTLLLGTPGILNLLVSGLYVLLALMIYKRTKYNLLLPLSAIMILILI